MSSNFFENKEIITERVKLAEDIELPESYDDYENITAKFYFNIYTPLVDKSKITSEGRPAPLVSRFNNNNLNPDKYETSNYIKLTIPRYILFQFKNKVPAGTEFIITCIGIFRIEHFRIIGLYSLDNEVNENESEKTTS
jgi:hypothetical protein